MNRATNAAKEHPTELLPDYVLGILTPQQTAAVEAHLASCEACQEEAWRLGAPLVLMTEALNTEAFTHAFNETAPLEPPPHVWEAIEARLRNERQGVLKEKIADEPTAEAGEEDTSSPYVPQLASIPTHYGWLAAACVSLLLVLSGVWGVQNYNALRRVQNETRLVSAFLARPQIDRVVLENTLANGPGGSLGSVLLTPDGEALFVLEQSAPPRRTYQAWGHTSSDWDPDRGEALTSLEVSRNAVFEVPAGGFASLYLSLEPAGGSPQPTNPLSKVSLLNPRPEGAVNITSPADGATLSAESTIVVGEVARDVTSLSYRVNGGEAVQTTAANNRFSFTVSGLRAGQNTVQVTATTADSRAETDTVTVTVEP